MRRGGFGRPVPFLPSGKARLRPHRSVLGPGSLEIEPDARDFESLDSPIAFG